MLYGQQRGKINYMTHVATEIGVIINHVSLSKSFFNFHVYRRQRSTLFRHSGSLVSLSSHAGNTFPTFF